MEAGLPDSCSLPWEAGLTAVVMPPAACPQVDSTRTSSASPGGEHSLAVTEKASGWPLWPGAQVTWSPARALPGFPGTTGATGTEVSFWMFPGPGVCNPRVSGGQGRSAGLESVPFLEGWMPGVRLAWAAAGLGPRPGGRQLPNTPGPPAGPSRTAPPAS